MPNERVRFTATAPDGQRYWKEYSLGYFTREEAHKLGEEWKQWVEQGKFQKHRKGSGQGPTASGGKVKDETESDSSSESEEESHSNFTLPNKSITSIELPGEGGASMLFLGSTRSGKTTMIKAIHEHFFDKHISVLHTGSPQAKTYDDLKKHCAIAPGFCDDIIEECMKINMKTDNKYKFCHIIDDCVSSKNNGTMVKLLTIGRNHNQSTLISGQELSILNAIGRSNINYVFLGKLNSSMAIEKAIKCYLLSHFPTNLKMGDKIKLYNELTKDHHWICLDAIENEAFITKLKL